MRTTGARTSTQLFTHNYVVVETAALTHRRLGPEAVRTFLQRHVPATSVLFVDPDVHARAAAAYQADLRRRTSLVDHVSFEVVRSEGLDVAFAFDEDFGEAGVEVVPSP